ncbi:MAG: SDR family oxidoreductase [Rhodospirillales bacterium]|nr:SDR family oxidoreductase [Rhodospirillales bacterium]
MIDFSGKVILVTGGSRGIGAACVKALVKTGGDVVLHYGSNKAAAETTAREAGANQCHLVQSDLSVPGAAVELWHQAVSWKGRVDVVVNNAGIFAPAPVDGPDVEWQDNWHRILQVNLIAAADLSRQAVNTWRAGPDSDSGGGVRGVIVNVASRASWRGDGPEYWSYAASKGGMISLMKTIARAHARDGILCYAVAPGFVETDMAIESFEHDPTLRDLVVRDIPMGDIAPASDVAHTVCFLASGLAPHATGTTIDVNGASYVR